MAMLKFRQSIADHLSANEKLLLPHLIKAVKYLDLVYQAQKNDSHKGANFYPQNISKDKIEESAQNDPRILSPFTVVKKGEQGKLIAVDYHEEYKELFKLIINELEKASKISKNKTFKKYLKSLIFALKEGKYHEADIAWLEIKGSNIFFVLGPFERYLDKLFFVKRVFQANIGLYNKEKSKEARRIRDLLYTTLNPVPNRIRTPVIVDTVVVKDYIFSGFLADTLFCEQHLPSDSDTTRIYGSCILIFSDAMEYKFEKLLYPVFQAIFQKEFKASYPKELLKVGNYYYVLLSAIGQFTNRYRNSRLRLRELFPIFDEANTILMGISQSKQLVLKGVINQKELEAIMIAQICWAFGEWIQSKKSKVREDYLTGDTLSFNFLFKVGALQEKDGISWPNFAKIFFETEHLASIFTQILSESSYIEGQEFLSKYLSLSPFKVFGKRLAPIKPI